MPVSLHLRGADLDAVVVQEAVEAVFEVFVEADRTFSTYRVDSAVNRIRRGELPLVDAGPCVRKVAALCEQATDVTVGAFTSRLPDFRGVLGFDPTGLVKGWAAERAADELRKRLPEAFCLNVGGDVVVGGDDDGPSWRVGIEDPRDRQRIAHVVTLRAGGVATSGTAARGAHLYDPATGSFVQRSGSVTVVGPSLMWSDVWATALFVGPAALANRFVQAATDYHMLTL